MDVKIYQLDAFSSHLFGGNPAAVCPLEAWLPDALMQQVAMENNLSETAFFVQGPNGLRIRWFTPTAEVRLCGHATLAAAWVYFHHTAPTATEVTFDSLSGPLGVYREGERLTLDFPVNEFHPATPPPLLIEALGTTPLECYEGEDWMVVLDGEESVNALRPQFSLLRRLEGRGLIVTARGDKCDFVSRFFAPKVGIDEDPVTGSAHTRLIPFWAARLGRYTLHARQLSARGGELFCELLGDRVAISGHVTPYLQGTLTMPDTLNGEKP